MDPTNRGSEAFHDDEQSSTGGPRKRRTPREPERADTTPGGQGPVRVVQLVSGDYLLTVNPVDGSEIEPCPPGSLPARPERHGPEARAELRRAARHAATGVYWIIPPDGSGSLTDPERLLGMIDALCGRETVAR